LSEAMFCFGCLLKKCRSPPFRYFILYISPRVQWSQTRSPGSQTRRVIRMAKSSGATCPCAAPRAAPGPRWSAATRPARLAGRRQRSRTGGLPAGRVGLLEARLLILVSTGVYAAACAALGQIYLKLALVPLAVFALYPYLKRFTPLCHAGVGVALSLAPLAGYAAA